MMRFDPALVKMFGGRAGRVFGPVAGLVTGVCVVLVVVAPGSAGAFALKAGSFQVTPSSSQAGAHGDLTTAFKLVHNAEGATKGNIKTTVVELPAGFIGSNTAVPACSPSELLTYKNGNFGEGATSCEPDTQVGTISFALALSPTLPFGVPVTVPLYNMQVTSRGVAAMFGFNFGGAVVQNLPIYVRPNDEGLTVASEQIQGQGEISEVSATVWGVPADPSHDVQRGEECDNGVCRNGGKTVSIAPKPLLANPTYCGTAPFSASFRTDDWQEENVFLRESTSIAPMVECERVPFNPSIEVQPTTRSAESPSGLNVSLVVPQSWDQAQSVAASDLKDVTLTLPEGMTINPSAGSGLAGCTLEQYAAETAEYSPGRGCPPESKIGSIEIKTPLLQEQLDGAVYVAMPYDNPFSEPGHSNGSLLALYIVARDEPRGVLIKVAGKVQLDPVTGRMTSTFLNNPQAPFSRFTLKFRPGATAPLVSPPACGTYTTQAALTPWSAPLEPRLTSNSFETTQGAHEGPCPSGGVLPFNPQVISGTHNNAASSYSPFYLRIERQDGEQELTRFSTTLPPGLTGNLSSIPFCPEAGIEAARNVTGAQEETNPSCPQASEIGHTIVEAGVGSVLAQTPGKVYLAGPYNGAPLSIVSITSAKVGPFDLGTVVIRFALNINPVTAQVEVSGAQSEAIPHIIRGVVVHVRDIRVYMSRPNFIINPTNCNPLSIADTMDGAGANFTNPADQVPVAVNTPFQAADCANLQFAPKFAVSTNGKTSKANGAGLSVKLTYPTAPLGTQANIRRVKVDLPKQLPSRLTTLQKACTEQEFNTNPATCPAASVIGHAKAITPILPVPLEGPAYFVSHGGAKFPELIMVLQGYGVTIDLHGETFISKAGITSSTFAAVPDQPVTSFELTLPQGPDSALATDLPEKDHYDLCGQKLTMPTEFVGQNGMRLRGQSTPVTVTGCPKTKTLTRAQKLATALKICHRKAKAKRASCERAARKAYGPLKRKRKK